MEQSLWVLDIGQCDFHKNADPTEGQKNSMHYNIQYNTLTGLKKNQEFINDSFALSPHVSLSSTTG